VLINGTINQVQNIIFRPKERKSVVNAPAITKRLAAKDFIDDFVIQIGMLSVKHTDILSVRITVISLLDHITGRSEVIHATDNHKDTAFVFISKHLYLPVALIYKPIFLDLFSTYGHQMLFETFVTAELKTFVTSTITRERTYKSLIKEVKLL